MKIEWNKVTWYSKLAASIVFVATFFLAFHLGISWEQTQVEMARTQLPVSNGDATTTDGTSIPNASGSVCGGFIKNASTCPVGYHCQLGAVADKGGTCVADAVTASTSSPIPSDMVTVTQQDQNTTVHLTKNERFAIQFGNLSWALSFIPGGAITRVPNTLSTGGYQGVYEANQIGTVTLRAEGRPICKAGEVCPQFIQELHITFVISN
ncbi:MAG TPA: hypothetical protein VMV38_00830 [Candidatus Paceibacterota bacterium]|nr:hypothetical protein [Candidatus Paceibacterota bacterium]